MAEQVDDLDLEVVCYFIMVQNSSRSSGSGCGQTTTDGTSAERGGRGISWFVGNWLVFYKEDLIMDKMCLYARLPIWAQNVACNYEGRKICRQRYGEAFKKALSEYESHNGWSYEQMCDYRDAQLRKLVRHCYATVPYYRKLFNDGGVNPESIKTLDDLKVLPILTKATIQNKPDQFISSEYAARRLTAISTSGSTGSSLVLKVAPDNVAKQYAVWWRYRRRLGIDFNMWHSEFGSRIIVPPRQKKPPYWRTSVPLKQVMYSAFHGNPNNFRFYFDKMDSDSFSWIHATPSVFMPFVAFCIENHLSLLYKVKYITTGAENLYDFQRRMIYDAFGVHPRTHYGLTEAVANFSESPDGIMEVDEDFAAVEFVPENDYCHIVGTSLINWSMPLLRYDTSDICFFTGKVGKHGRIVDKIDGRTGDSIYLPNGTKVGTLSALFSETENIVEAQIYQKKDFSLTIKYVPKNERYVSDLKEVEKLLNDRINGAIPYKFVRVDKIERTARGKLRYIVTEVEPSNAAIPSPVDTLKLGR